MKTIKLFSLIFAFALLSNMAFASGTGTSSLLVDVKQVDANRAIVEIQNSTVKNYNVAIYDANGNQVLTDASKGAEAYYKKVYNFEDLADGSYEMVVKTDKIESKNDFHIQSHELVFGQPDVEVDPFFHQNGKVLRMAYLNNTGKPATLTIFNSADEAVYEKPLGSDFGVNVALDLSNLFIGNYRAELAVGDRYYNYDFR